MTEKNTLNIWAITKKTTYKKLKEGNKVYCSIEDTPWGKTEASVAGYQFVSKYMTRHARQFAPMPSTVPFLAWVSFMGESTHPDKESDFFRRENDDMVYVPLTVPRQKVLLSDATAWVSIMYGDYFAMSSDPDTIDAEINGFSNIDETRKKERIQSSWNAAFQIKPWDFQIKPWDFTAGCLWEICPEMLRTEISASSE